MEPTIIVSQILKQIYSVLETPHNSLTLTGFQTAISNGGSMIFLPGQWWRRLLK